MGRFNSRAKGNGYELKIAKILCAAWGFKLVRTPNSGAFKKLAPADIIPEDRQLWLDFPYHLECKNRVGWRLEQLLSNDHCQVIDWYKEEEAKQVAEVGDKFYEKQMLLIFTKNHDANYVMYRNSSNVSRAKVSVVMPKHLVFFDENNIPYTIMLLSDFLNYFDYEVTKQANLNRLLKEKAVKILEDDKNNV